VKGLPLFSRLARLGTPSILVLGDFMLDEYWWGTAERLSPEGPVAVLSLAQRSFAPGGAGNVAMNVLALGGRPLLAGVIGDDQAGRDLLGVLERGGVSGQGLVVDPGRTTPLKTRIGTRSQALLRVDREQVRPLSEAAAQALQEAISRSVPRVDAVIVSDYAKGGVNPRAMATLVEVAGRHRVDIIADPKGTDCARFARVRYLVPNERELRDLAGLGWSDAAGRARVAQEVLERTAAEAILLTRSEHGVELHARGEDPLALEGQAREVYDVTGAGDTFVAAVALGAAEGWTLVESAALGNLAAGLKVAKRGTAVVHRAELQAALAALELTPAAKLRPLEEVVAATEVQRREGRRLVFTNGCFDLLHAGHVRYLAASRALGDCLVVGLNSDASVRRLKGPGRPILELEERAQILSALSSVDYIVAFDEDTPLELILKLRPDILTKGADYALQDVVGADLLGAWGGRVELVPLERGKSTTGIIERIRDPRLAPRP
jgi:D-beta-D-heptose 7-phosphate kinase/D-beta-D-heptose 1-phosphate adenosyltransferase